MSHYSLFIADIHLTESEPHIAKRFCNFLEKDASSADALYILGDLFEVWIGDDDDSVFNRAIKTALRTITKQKNIPIYIMHGNRDFLIGRKFLKETGCQLLKDPSLISLYETPILLTHGDILCTLDKNYIAFRKKARNRFNQLLFLWKPLKKRKSIATQIREKSKEAIKAMEPDQMDIVTEAVKKILQKYPAQYLIHGHIHKPSITQIKNNHLLTTRIVLPSWETGGQALKLSVDEHQKKLSFEYLDF